MPPKRRVQRTPTPPGSVVAEVLSSIRTLVASLSRSARTIEQRTGITNAQLFLLRELAGRDELTINELAARVMTTQSTVSVLVTRLEAAGLVRRSRGNADARRVQVALTKTGAALAAKAPEPPTRQLIDAIEGLRNGELVALATALRSLLERLELTVPEGPPLFEQIGDTDEHRLKQRRASKRGASRRS